MKPELTLARLAARCAAACGVLAACVLAAPAGALEWGALQVQSAINQPLVARLPFTAAPGERVDAQCLRLDTRAGGAASGAASGASSGSLPRVPNVRIEVKREASGPYVAISSAKPLAEPAYRFALVNRCGGASTLREFNVLLDQTAPVAAPPPVAAVPLAAPAPVAVAGADPPSARAPANPSANLISREGTREGASERAREEREARRAARREAAAKAAADQAQQRDERRAARQAAADAQAAARAAASESAAAKPAAPSSTASKSAAVPAAANPASEPGVVGKGKKPTLVKQPPAAPVAAPQETPKAPAAAAPGQLRLTAPPEDLANASPRMHFSAALGDAKAPTKAWTEAEKDALRQESKLRLAPDIGAAADEISAQARKAADADVAKLRSDLTAKNATLAQAQARAAAAEKKASEPNWLWIGAALLAGLAFGGTCMWLARRNSAATVSRRPRVSPSFLDTPTRSESPLSDSSADTAPPAVADAPAPPVLEVSPREAEPQSFQLPPMGAQAPSVPLAVQPVAVPPASRAAPPKAPEALPPIAPPVLPHVAPPVAPPVASPPAAPRAPSTAPARPAPPPLPPVAPLPALAPAALAQRSREVEPPTIEPSKVASMMAEDAQSMGVFSVSPSGLSRETPNASRAQTLPAAGIEPPMMREAEPPTFDPALVKLVAEADAQVATPPALDVPPITMHAADSTVLAARAQLDAGQVDIDLEAPKDLEPLAFEPASVSSAKVSEKATAKPTGNATENATEKPTANAAQPTDISPRVAATLLPDLPEQPYTRTIVMPPKGKAPTTQVAPAFNVPAPAPEAPVVPREPAAARDPLSMSGPMATLPAASGPIKRDQDEDKTVLLDPRLARQTTNVPDGLQIEFVGDTTGALAVGSEFPAADASSAPVDFDFDKKTVILDKPAIIDFDSFTTTVKPADKQPPAAATAQAATPMVPVMAAAMAASRPADPLGATGTFSFLGQGAFGDQPAGQAAQPAATGQGAAGVAPAFDIFAITPQAAPASNGPARADAYRKEFLAQRFPEVASGYVKLTDIESVRRVARVYYQDDLNGEKAIELLTYAMEYQSKEQRDGRRNEPPDQKLWLALFDLYRLESRATEYVSLAARYRKAFPKDDKYHWPRIAKDGARLDPTFAPFAPFASDEEDDDMDSPWLGSTLDMTGAVLSRELRDALREPGSVAVAYFHVAP